jgi:hypothetical protein
MNKPYFAKYLPVEGEIKESPLWDKKMNKARVFDISTPEKLQLFHKVMTVDNYQPVKLFICSRNIQVGDKFFHETLATKSKHICIELAGEQGIVGDDNVNYFKGSCYKVIGEISTEARWVKEGDEFNEENIQRCIWTAPDSKTEERDMIPVQTDKWFNMKYKKDIGEWIPLPLENKVIMIKGPCGHFH